MSSIFNSLAKKKVFKINLQVSTKLKKYVRYMQKNLEETVLSDHTVPRVRTGQPFKLPQTVRRLRGLCSSKYQGSGLRSDPQLRPIRMYQRGTSLHHSTPTPTIVNYFHFI